MATVEGAYAGKYPLNKGVQGKYTNGLVTMMGICYPRWCEEDDIRYYTQDLIRGYAEGAGFKNVKVKYDMVSKYDVE